VTAAAAAAGCVAGAYAVGTVPTARIVGRAVGHDPTAEGSGNPGASTVYRLAGRRAGALVFVVDAAKGAIATAAGLAIGGRALGLAAGLAAVIGHVAPVTRRLRGGRGVATAIGSAAAAFPVVGAGVAAVWVVVAAILRTASVASLVAMTAMPIGVAADGRPGWEVGVAAAIAAIVVARHATNVRRLLRGEERVLTGGEHH